MALLEDAKNKIEKLLGMEKSVTPDKLAKVLTQSNEGESAPENPPAQEQKKWTGPQDLDKWLAANPGKIPEDQLGTIKQLVQLYYTSPDAAMAASMKDAFLGKGLGDIWQHMTGEPLMNK